MQNNTFKNNDEFTQPNKDFYFLKLDAKDKSNITFYGRLFNLSPLDLMLEYMNWLNS